MLLQHGCFSRSPPPAIAQELPALATVGVSLEQASDIKTQPLLLLSKFPSAGPALAKFVAQALAKEPEAVDAVLSIMPDTSPEQAAAIGAGMVRALRAMGNASGELARNVTYKVMMSDNKWLKTTFSAIGPRSNGTLPSGKSYMVGALDHYPAMRNAGGGGAAIGSPLANDEWRVGPSVVTNLGGDFERLVDGLETQENARFTRYGMIIAIIKSDGPSNGVVSTSPTI